MYCLVLSTYRKMLGPSFAKNSTILNVLKKAVSRNTEITRRFASSAGPQIEVFMVQDPKDFDERVKNSKVPVIIDFFATWCNPCRTLTPRIESVIAETKGKVVLAKVDIDENTDLALDYDIGSVPVLIAMKNGKVEDKLIGLQDTDKLRKFVNKVID